MNTNSQNEFKVSILTRNDFPIGHDYNKQDRQGIRWNSMGFYRDIYRKKREMQYIPFRDNMEKQMTKYPKQTKVKNDIYQYESYYQNLPIKITHFQLRYCIQSLTPNDIVLISRHGISQLNTINQTRIDKELKYDLQPTMLNIQGNLIAMGGLEGDVSIIDGRNLKEISHFMVSEPNNITNFVGFLSNSCANQVQEMQNFENYTIQSYQEEIQLLQELNQRIHTQSSYNLNEQMEEEQEEQNQNQFQYQQFNQLQQQQLQQQQMQINILNDMDVKLLTGCNDKKLKLFDLESNKEIHQESFGTAPNVAAYNKHKQLIALQCDQLQTEILDSRSLKSVMSLKGHEDYGFSVDWHPQGMEVATGNQDGTVRIYDIRTGKCLKILQGEIAHTCCVKYTDQHLIVGEAIDYVHVFDRDYQQQTIDFFGEPNGISVCGDKLYFGVNMQEYEGIFEYSLKKPDVNILQECEEMYL